MPSLLMPTRAHLWADQFDADRTDLLQMQDEIVTRLSRALQIRLIEVDAAHVARTHPDDPDAEQLAMRCETVLQTLNRAVLKQRKVTVFANVRWSVMNAMFGH